MLSWDYICSVGCGLCWTHEKVSRLLLEAASKQAKLTVKMWPQQQMSYLSAGLFEADAVLPKQ